MTVQFTSPGIITFQFVFHQHEVDKIVSFAKMNHCKVKTVDNVCTYVLTSKDPDIKKVWTGKRKTIV